MANNMWTQKERSSAAAAVARWRRVARGDEGREESRNILPLRFVVDVVEVGTAITVVGGFVCCHHRSSRFCQRGISHHVPLELRLCSSGITLLARVALEMVQDMLHRHPQCVGLDALHCHVKLTRETGPSWRLFTLSRRRLSQFVIPAT